MEPPVSVPKLIKAEPAATEEAEPPEEPPEDKSIPSILLHGLIAGPNILVSLEEPIANSSQFNFPSITPPDCQILDVTVLSYEGKNPLSIAEHAVVSISFVQNKSLTPIGNPAKGPAFP